MQQKISQWTKVGEFDTSKVIQITSIRRLCGVDTTAAPEFRDADGCIFRMTFNDIDNGGMERKFEIKFESFMKDVAAAGVKKGGTYKVTRTHERKYWKWVFEASEASPNKSDGSGEMLAL